MRNRTGKEAQDKTCERSMEGEIQSEQHMLLKCPTYRIARKIMFEEGKENIKGREMGVWMGKEEAEKLEEIVGLVRESSEILARTVGEV